MPCTWSTMLPMRQVAKLRFREHVTTVRNHARQPDSKILATKTASPFCRISTWSCMVTLQYQPIINTHALSASVFLYFSFFLHHFLSTIHVSGVFLSHRSRVSHLNNTFLFCFIFVNRKHMDKTRNHSNLNGKTVQGRPCWWMLWSCSFLVTNKYAGTHIN